MPGGTARAGTPPDRLAVGKPRGRRSWPGHEVGGKLEASGRGCKPIPKQSHPHLAPDSPDCLRRRKYAVVKNCGAAKTAELQNHPGHISQAAPTSAIATLASGSHPSRFSSELRASRNCGQRSCDRLSGKLAACCDVSVDREAETFDGKAKVQCFRGPPPRSWRENESAVPAVFPRHKAQALQTKVRPRPPTAVSNPTKTKRSQKSNAASSQTGVRR